MSNTFILVDEVLLSRLKEFVIKEISLIHTLQDQSASTRPKRMGIQHVGLLKKKGIQPVGTLRVWSIQSVGPLIGGPPVLSYLERIGYLASWFFKRTGHL